MYVMHELCEIGTSAASRILGVTIVTVTRWAKVGYLPHVRKEPGTRGQWVFDAEVVARLADDRRTALAALGRTAAA